MIDTKKEQERDELHRAIWAIADENLNETLESVFRHIEESAQGSKSEGSYAGLFDDYDVNSNNKILFIDASNECVKVTNNNKLTPKNIDKIVDVFTRREEVKHFTHLAGYEEVVENDYNLSVSTYVEAEDTREKIDIKKLNVEIEKIVAREQVLRDEIAKIIAEIEV